MSTALVSLPPPDTFYQSSSMWVDEAIWGHRLYDEKALLRLSWIDKLQLLGFSLPRIRELLGELEDAEHGPAAMSKVREIFRFKLEETQAQIKSLTALAGELQDSLRYLESCTICEPSTLLCSCTVCEHPHPVEPPTLIAGLHTCGHTKETDTKEQR